MKEKKTDIVVATTILQLEEREEKSVDKNRIEISRDCLENK